VARSSGLVVLSVIVHGALAFGVGRIEIKKSRAATAIEYAETQKKKAPPPEPAKVDDAPPPEKTARSVAHRPAPAPLPAPAAEEPAKTNASPALDALPDFGLSLSGGVGGPGMALPSGGGGAAREHVVEKVVRKAPVAAALPADDCDEPPAKPKALSSSKPSYTEDAIAAAIEGKVRLQITVDETGAIVDVKVVQGLGHGLDEAAIAAARRMSFEPAVRCGKPTRATFKLAMVFSLPH